MTASPAVSVVMGVYNGARYLRAAIESVLAQQGVDFEFVIVDDGSTDATPTILADATSRDARVRVITQTNAGLTQALIRGCAEARGRYIARQDGDDLSLPDRLRLQAAMLDADSALVFVSCWSEVIGPNDEPLITHRRPDTAKAATNLLIHGRSGPPGHGSVMFRRDAYERVGGYRTLFYYAQDGDLWLRLAAIGQLNYVQRVLYRYRISAESISGQLHSAKLPFARLIDELHAARQRGEDESAIRALYAAGSRAASACKFGGQHAVLHRTLPDAPTRCPCPRVSAQLFAQQPIQSAGMVPVADRRNRSSVLVTLADCRTVRILFAADVDPDPNSGAAGTEWQTILALRELGHDVDEIWAADLGRRIRHGNLHYLLELPRAYRRVIGERCRQHRYDVVHANQGHCYLAARAHHEAGRAGVFVCRSHGLDDHMGRTLAPWRRRLGVRSRSGLKALVGGAVDRLLYRHDRLAYRDADGVLVSSSGDERYLTDAMSVPAARVARIAQAPAEAFVASAAPTMDAARLTRILHVGGFAYWKGVHAVAATANRLFEHERSVQMTWVCRRDEHDRVRELLTPAARARVELVAWATQQELLAIYDSHGVFLCPSLFDGFGKVFLEAMARGLCVIGTPTGGMPDVIVEGVNGHLVGFNDADAIVSRIESLWSEPVLAERMSVAAAGRAREYSWQRVANETIHFYSRLLALRTRAQET